jgi:hypothetical protein
MTDAYHHQYDVNVARPAAERIFVTTFDSSLAQSQSQVHPDGV